MIELLHFVSENPRISNQELATRLQLSWGTISNVLGRAERRGLLERSDQGYLLDQEEIERYMNFLLIPLVFEAVHKHPGQSADQIFKGLDAHRYIPRQAFDKVIEELLADYTFVGSPASLNPNHPRDSRAFRHLSLSAA